MGNEAPPLHTVVAASPASRNEPVRLHRVLGWLLAAGVLVLLGVTVLGVQAARQLAEDEAVNEAARTASLIGTAVIEPVLTDSVVTGDAAALQAVDEAVRDRVLDDSTRVRVKIWDHDGTIVYSDEPRLIGQRFELEEEELEALAGTAVDAEVSDLRAPENRYERERATLLEAYSGISTPGGDRLLFETYFRYDDVVQRSAQLWQGFAVITLGSILLVLALLSPLLGQMLRALDRAREQRERLLQQALESSSEERRRIAGTLHDGVVQELTAASFSIAASAAQARSRGETEVATVLGDTAGTVRSSIGGLRSLLVDIYPPSLSSEGIAAALNDLVAPLRARGVAVDLDVALAVPLDAPVERLVFRVAQECLQNVAKHAQASSVRVRLQADATGLDLSIQDDGVGFDAEHRLRLPLEGHFGLRLLRDLVADGGGELKVGSAPGAGTRWRLRRDLP
ncbi:sensor histidine kinase [Microbacteriaceae bacterium 4G12]